MVGGSTLEQRNQHFDALVGRADLKWLGQNTNHAKPHPAVLAAMHDCIDSGEIHIYAPPLGLEELRRAILADLGLDSGFSAMVTDGAIEGLYHACHTFLREGDDFVVTDPGWLWPRRFAASRGARVVEVEVYNPAAGYRLDPERLRAAITDKTRLIYLVDPNNPLGTIQTPEEIEAITAIARDAGALLIHDCTYRHFAEGHTLAAPHYPEGTITTYSFSKWLGLAGLRVGAVVAAPELIEQLADAPPNNLGSSFLAQRAAIAGLKHKEEWFPEVQRRQRENQARIKETVDRIPGLEMPVYPSQANFVAIDVQGAAITPDALCAFYLEHDILIRQGSYHSGTFGDRFVKVSTSVPRDWIDEFCGLLEDAVAKSREAAPAAALF